MGTRKYEVTATTSSNRIASRRHRRQMSFTRDLRFDIGDVDTGVLALGERLDRPIGSAGPEFGPVRLRCARVAAASLVFHGNLNCIG